MPIDVRVSKKVTVGTITASTEFTEFEGISLWDAGDDGFKLEDEDGNTCEVPNGESISIGGSGTRNCSYIKVIAPAAGSLNCSYILYQ